MGKLKDVTIRTAKPKEKRYELQDGDGLVVIVNVGGTKAFQFRAMINRKKYKMHIGQYPDLSLSDARREVERLRQEISDGNNPFIKHKLEKNGFKEAPGSLTFFEAANNWLKLKTPPDDFEDDGTSQFLSPATLKKAKNTLNANIHPWIGDIPIADITYPVIRDLLFKIQDRGALDVMNKTKGFVNQIFNLAVADAYIEFNPIPAVDQRLKKGNSKQYPPFRSLIDAGEMLFNLSRYHAKPEAIYCAYLTVHLAQRPSELRTSKWTDFDLEHKKWTMPMEVIKTRKHMTVEHDVMLSDQVIAALTELKKHSINSEYTFPSRVRNKKTGKYEPISDTTVRNAFKNTFTQYKVVPHGCRHFFSTNANENQDFRSLAIEKVLGHKDKNEIRAVYNKAGYDEERMEIMQWWSDQLDKAKAEYANNTGSNVFESRLKI